MVFEELLLENKSPEEAAKVLDMYMLEPDTPCVYRNSTDPDQGMYGVTWSVDGKGRMVPESERKISLDQLAIEIGHIACPDLSAEIGLRLEEILTLRNKYKAEIEASYR